MAMIIDVFGLSPTMPNSVIRADFAEAARECEAMWRPPVWGFDREHVITLQPGQAAPEFLERFKELTK
jgi:hypothetical protein